MYDFMNKQIIRFHICCDVLSLFCQRKCWKTFPHFEFPHGQQNTVSRATCCPRATGWAGLL